MMEVIQKSVATAVVEAMKHFHLPGSGAGAEDGGRSLGEGRMMREVVDTVVKRTDKFCGSGFQDWKFRMEMAVRGSCGRLHDFMEWAEEQELYIDPVTSVTEENSGYNSNLYCVLAQRTEGEAFDVVKNVASQNGGEAWRKLCRRFSGKTRGKRLHLIRKCVNPPRVKKLNEVTGMVEKWEMNTRRLETDFKEELSSGLKSGILVEMMPSDVAEHLSQKISDGDQYEDVKEMISRYVETKADHDGNAMEVDNVELYDQDQHHHQHDDEGGLNMMHKGKGKGGDFYGYCNSCGAWGHRAADCPGKSSMRCYHCGQTGHRLSECPVKDAEMKGKGKGKYGKGFTNKGKGNFKGSDYKGSGKMGGFQNNGYVWNSGWKGKGSKDTGKGWSANAVWEDDAWEETPGAQAMQLFGVMDDREKVNHTLTTAAGHARRTARNTLTAPPGLPLQNRFSELAAEEDDIDDEDGIPVMALFSPEPEINHLKQGPRWVKLETVVDSGAAESVAPVGMAPWVPRQESEGSKRGPTYLSASGDKLPNMGEKKFDMVTPEGHWAQATFQVAEVTRPLCSVSKMCDKGNRVVFELGGGYVEHLKSGMRTKFTRQNNVYVMDMYVQDPGVRLEDTDFGRQGK